MVRRSAWATLAALMKASYPIWFEDVDFCKRLRDRGIEFVSCLRR